MYFKKIIRPAICRPHGSYEYKGKPGKPFQNSTKPTMTRFFNSQKDRPLQSATLLTNNGCTSLLEEIL